MSSRRQSELRPEYDFRGGERGKYAARYDKYTLGQLLKGVTRKNLHQDVDFGLSPGREGWSDTGESGGYMPEVAERYVVDAKGRKTGVILPLKRYRKLLEDLHDLAVVAERRDEVTDSLTDVKRRLKRDGLL